VTPLRTIHIESLDALRAMAAAWDDLWRRSEATLPSLRADMLAQWVEQFAQPDDFHAVAIEADGRLAAAMPLVRRRIAGVIEAGAMPCNEWSASGDLLLDPSEGRALDAMATAIRELPWPLLWLDEAMLDAPRWQALQEVFVREGMTVAKHPRWQVGRVEIDHDWPAYKANWSRKHRQKMAWSLRRLVARGKVRLTVRSQWSPDEVATAMQQCFEIEDHGWKGAAGTSMLRTPGMAEFFVRQAELAAQGDHLEVATLHCGGRPVAFCYGLSAKGVFHSVKTSYDPAYARQRPGQLLRYCLLERFFADPERKAMDFQGSMTEAHAAWLPQRYTLGRLAIAPRSFWGRLAVQAYRNLWLTLL
jgi:CelD/BcsL family acetyltransferase involved in cellulose biosynthesis